MYITKEKKYFKKYCSIFLLSCFFGVIFMNIAYSICYGFKKEEPKRVLFISSYSPSFETFFQQVEGIKSQFDDKLIKLDIEFMDSKRFYTEENLRNFHTNLTYKLKNLQPYDAVIVADDNALNFIMTFGKECFGNIPIVFMGINDIANAIKVSKEPNITGVIEAVSIKDTIDIAMKLNKKAVNVVALTDITSSGQGDLASFYEEAKHYDDLTFKDLDLSDMSFADFEEALRQLKETDIVLLLSVFSDKLGESVTFDDGLERILSNCNQPVYHLYYHGLGQGIIGGKVISHYEQGKEAASMVNRILGDEEPASIPLLNQNPNQVIFDYNVLQCHGLDEKLLPKGAIILNEKESFFTKYGSCILIIISVISFEAYIIMRLLGSSRKNKKVERELLESKENLQESNEELMAANAELTAVCEELKVQDSKIYELVYTDSLTGLNNRLSITQTIDYGLSDRQEGELLTVIYLNIDNFKNINDTYGHEIGDMVIQTIATRLKQFDGEHISVGRFSGDEFILVVKKCSDMKKTYEVVEAVKRIFSEQVLIDNNRLFVTASMGVASCPRDGVTRKELIKRADMAMYKAKDLGRNTAVFFEMALDKMLSDKIKLQKAIINAYKNKEFFLNYQPYVDAKTKEVVGFEALIRWISKDYGYVSPYLLITNAEEMGLIVEIGEWVMEQACLFAKKMNASRTKKLTISINVSAVQLMCDDFYTRTMDIVQKSGVDPHSICLEMTETMLIESLEKSVSIIKRLKEIGIKIAIDDFGTGYSSLKYFKELPIDILKIDKSFIENITTSSYDSQLVDLIVSIAHKRNVNVVGEGVETQEQYDKLIENNCDIIQGYLFSKPMSEDEVFTLYRKE